jgi:hypothetical protein
MVARKSALSNQTDFISNEDGSVSISYYRASQLLNVQLSTLKRVLKSDTRLATILMERGFDCAHFSSNLIPDLAFQVVVEYYAFHANRTTVHAKTLAATFMAHGIRVWAKQQLEESKKERDTLVKYKETYHGLMDELKDHDCEPVHYATVNKSINDMCGVENGQRDKMARRQRALMLMCQGAAEVKLIDRPQDKKWDAVKTSVTAAKGAVDSLDYGDYPELLPY